jgi:hypothetical protein
MGNLKNATAEIAGVFRQLSNAYFKSSNVNVLLTGRNVIVSRLATLVTNYLRAPSLLVFAAWKNKIPFEPIDQIAMIECVSENWPVCATGSPVQFTSLTEDQALLLRPCLQAALGEDALPSGKECRSIISNMLLSGMLKHPSGGENEDKVKRSSSSSRGNSSSRMGMAVLPDSRDRVEVRRRRMRLKLIDLWIPDTNSKTFHAINPNALFMALLLGLGDSYYENLALQTPPLVKCQ